MSLHAFLLVLFYVDAVEVYSTAVLSVVFMCAAFSGHVAERQLF